MSVTRTELVMGFTVEFADQYAKFDFCQEMACIMLVLLRECCPNHLRTIQRVGFFGGTRSTV